MDMLIQNVATVATASFIVQFIQLAVVCMGFGAILLLALRN